jgi:hypothetical protein
MTIHCSDKIVEIYEEWSNPNDAIVSSNRQKNGGLVRRILSQSFT